MFIHFIENGISLHSNYIVLKNTTLHASFPTARQKVDYNCTSGSASSPCIEISLNELLTTDLQYPALKTGFNQVCLKLNTKTCVVYFEQLLFASSTQKLVEIHNKRAWTRSLLLTPLLLTFIILKCQLVVTIWFVYLW